MTFVNSDRQKMSASSKLRPIPLKKKRYPRILRTKFINIIDV